MNKGSDIYREPASEFGGGESDSVSFGNYRCISEHGVNRLGVVQRYDRFFFVKSLREPYSSMQLYRAQLRKEFKMLLSLRHPGIVRVYDMEEIPGVGLSILMDYVSGVTLGEWLKQGHLRRERRKVADELLEAAAVLHAAGMVHRDLKPDNVMVTPSAEVRIIDFGLCDEEAYALLKQPSGTRGFAAPEQMEEGYKASPTCDVYALGLLLKMLRPGYAYMAAARKGLNEDPRKRPQDAKKLMQCVRRVRRRIDGFFVTAVVAAISVIAVAMLPHNPNEEASANVAPEVTAKHDPAIHSQTDDTDTSACIDATMEVKENGLISAAPEQKSRSDLRYTVLAEDIENKLAEKAAGVLSGLKDLRADPEMSQEWRMIASAKLIAELEAYHAQLVNTVAKMTDADGRSVYPPDRFDWDNLKSGKLRREAIALHDSIQADSEFAE